MSSPPAPGRLRWWREVLYILAFYSAYTLVRNRGVATDSVAEARRHALEVIALERRLGAYWEEAIQERFLDWTAFIQFWNIFYGTAHFIVTVFAFVYLFRRMAHRYPLWRNTLACTTGLALVGFAFYPLMPPRLLGPSFGFVDTLKDVGGLWSFDSGAVARVSNQYAAMPSLHFAWSTWCALVLYPAVRRPSARLVVVAYPALTVFAIVVTANHYWLDAVGGAATLAAGFSLGRAITRALEARGLQPLPETVDDEKQAERRESEPPEPVPAGVAPVGLAATRRHPPAESGPAEEGGPPEPVVAGAEPVVAGAEPVVTGAEPVVAGAEPVVTGAEPVVAGAEPVVTGAEPVVTGAEPVVTGAEPVVAGAEPVVTGAEPVVSEPDPAELVVLRPHPPAEAGPCDGAGVAPIEEAVRSNGHGPTLAASDAGQPAPAEPARPGLPQPAAGVAPASGEPAQAPPAEPTEPAERATARSAEPAERRAAEG